MANAKKLEKENNEDTAWWDWSDEARAKDKRRERRRDIIETTKAEVDEEVAHMRNQIKNGKPDGTKITAKDVKDLAERKELEHDIEMKHFVNMTNDPGKDKGGEADRRVWGKEGT